MLGQDVQQHDPREAEKEKHLLELRGSAVFIPQSSGARAHMHEEVGESAGWGWGQPFGPRLEGGEGRSRDTAALQVALLRVKLGQVIAET